MHITFDLAIDLNQPLGADIAHNFKPAADDSSATHYSEHDTLPGLRTTPVKASIQAGRNSISLKYLYDLIYEDCFQKVTRHSCQVAVSVAVLRLSKLNITVIG